MMVVVSNEVVESRDRCGSCIVHRWPLMSLN